MKINKNWLWLVFCVVAGISAWMAVGRSPGNGYKVDPNAVETSEDFSAFLESCTLEERIALMQSLKGLKQDLGPDCFGKLKGLAKREQYAESREKATADAPLLPETYNDVSPMTVADAMGKGHLSEDLVSPLNIKKQMVWRRYNKINYVFHEKEMLDYHRDYVMWAAKKCGIDAKERDVLPTFYLERKIYEKQFADVWDKLSPEQRIKVLAEVESKAGSVGNKVAIASMSGAGAIAALSTTAAFTGFAFYTSITSGMAVAAGWVGVTLPFAAYTTATSTAAVLTGPIGWCVAGGALVAGGIAAGWPDKDLVIAFVMTANAIKAKRL